VPLRDALLFELDMLLPLGEQLVDGRIVGRRHGIAYGRSKPARFVDQGSEDVEDDDVDVADLGHAFSCSGWCHGLRAESRGSERSAY
jgi:hypothetical protein